MRPLFIIILLLTLVSCGKYPSNAPEPKPPVENQEVNEWIYGRMSYYYYWHAQLKKKENTSQDLHPVLYFGSILNAADRFSAITPVTATKADNNENYATDYGVKTRRVTFSGRNYEYQQIMQVIPGSSAQKAGITRGDIFSAFDGNAITSDNYATVFAGSSVLLTQCDKNGEKIKDIRLAKAQYLNSPILLDTVYRFNSGNVGYLYYTNFESGSNNTFSNALKSVFQQFKADNIQDLILDLRYNPGGELKLVVELSSMIVQQSHAANQDIFAYMNYNGSPYSKEQKAATEIRFNNLEKYNVNLPRLYVIATGSSASSSELTFYCLRQFMEVIHYGTTTVGKNMGSVTVSNAGYEWELHPIVARISDKRHTGDPGYESGLVPDVWVKENESLYLGQIGEHDRDKAYEPMLTQVLEDAGYLNRTKASTQEEDISGSFGIITPVEDRGIRLD